MAEFITKCPHCNIELQVQEEWVGMEVGCPQCQKTFTITPNVPVKKLVTGKSTFLTNKLNKYVNTIKESVNFTKTPPLTTPNENAVTRNYFRDKLNLYVITMGIATFLFLKLFPLSVSLWIDYTPTIGSKGSSTIIFLLWMLSILAIAFYYVAISLEAYLLYEFINCIPKKHQRQNPIISAILLLIPGWCFVWNFCTLPMLATDLRNEIIRLNKNIPKNLYYNTIVYSIMSVVMILLAASVPLVIFTPFLKAIQSGTILFTIIMLFCCVISQYQTYSVLAKAAALVKEE